MASDLTNLSIDELQALLAEQDSIRVQAKQRGREIKAEIEQRFQDEEIRKWEVTPQQFEQAKQQSSAHRVAWAAMDDAKRRLTRQLRLASNKKLSAPDRLRASEQAAKIQAELAKLEQEFLSAARSRQPLSEVLNDIRRANGKEPRKIQTASA